METSNRKVDDAARAAWMSFVAGMKQDEIAVVMGISRQSVQRLVAQAMADGLVKIRIDHPVARCLELASDLRNRYGLDVCQVVPSMGSDRAGDLAVSNATGDLIESWLLRQDPQIIGLGTGKTLQGAIEHLPHLDCAAHKIVSLTGNIAPDGSTAYYNVLFTITDKVSAQTFPMPMPVIASSPEEKRVLLAQATLSTMRQHVMATDVRFIGIGALNRSAPLVNAGFITAEVQQRLQAKGAVGEILGWCFDANGDLVDDELNARVTSAELVRPTGGPTIAAARGSKKVNAIRAALVGGLISGLITDEPTAEALI